MSGACPIPAAVKHTARLQARGPPCVLLQGPRESMFGEVAHRLLYGCWCLELGVSLWNALTGRPAVLPSSTLRDRDRVSPGRPANLAPGHRACDRSSSFGLVSAAVCVPDTCGFLDQVFGRSIHPYHRSCVTSPKWEPWCPHLF